jgi:hypothetical protein
MLSGALLVIETDLDADAVQLELLDVEQKEGCCLAQLPLRLRELHSHWVCR